MGAVVMVRFLAGDLSMDKMAGNSLTRLFCAGCERRHWDRWMGWRDMADWPAGFSFILTLFILIPL